MDEGVTILSVMGVMVIMFPLPPQFKVSGPDARRHLSSQSRRTKASGKNTTHVPVQKRWNVVDTHTLFEAQFSPPVKAFSVTCFENEAHAYDTLYQYTPLLCTVLDVLHKCNDLM